MITWTLAANINPLPPVKVWILNCTTLGQRWTQFPRKIQQLTNRWWAEPKWPWTRLVTRWLRPRRRELVSRQHPSRNLKSSITWVSGIDIFSRSPKLFWAKVRWLRLRQMIIMIILICLKDSLIRLPFQAHLRGQCQSLPPQREYRGPRKNYWKKLSMRSRRKITNPLKKCNFIKWWMKLMTYILCIRIKEFRDFRPQRKRRKKMKQKSCK